jgi:hypothetical protein
VFEDKRGLEQEDEHLDGELIVTADFEVVHQRSDTSPGFLQTPELSQPHGTCGGPVDEIPTRQAGPESGWLALQAHRRQRARDLRSRGSMLG